jgi:hypothetical protein
MAAFFVSAISIHWMMLSLKEQASRPKLRQQGHDPRSIRRLPRTIVNAPDVSGRASMHTERLQSLADGIFAVALTLLVLNLPLLKASRHLGHELLSQSGLIGEAVGPGVSSLRWSGRQHATEGRDNLAYDLRGAPRVGAVRDPAEQVPDPQ